MDNSSVTVVVTIALFGLMNVGALIYFAGEVRTELRCHKERLDKNEDNIDVLRADVSQLQGRFETI